jgi:CDP-paratose 2-epimerase
MKWIITGGCGFIGTNAAMAYAGAGDDVVVLDNLMRPQGHRNLVLLRDTMGLECHVGDVRDRDAVDRLVRSHADADAILHLAGQVSLLASIEDPRYDFEANALGTLNVLESTRRHAPGAVVLYASTNKVYGDLGRLRTEEQGLRYVLTDLPDGIDETAPLDFHGGYGCSKGAADQYVLDYHRNFDLRTISLRQSSIYGGRQYATADQGWVAYFVHVGIAGTPFGINGSGKQVRDALHVSDLLDLYRRCVDRIDSVQGLALNVGGGSQRSSSILELFELLEDRYGFRLSHRKGPARPGDQKVFIADTTRARDATGWEPTVELVEGLDELVAWTREYR